MCRPYGSSMPEAGVPGVGPPSTKVLMPPFPRSAGGAIRSSPRRASILRASTRLVLARFEAQGPRDLRRIRDLSDVAPGLLVVWDDELVHPVIDHVPLDAGREGEQHES